MKSYIKRFFGGKTESEVKDAAYSFLADTSSKEKKKVLVEIVRQSNKDQQALEDEYCKIAGCDS